MTLRSLKVSFDEKFESIQNWQTKWELNWLDSVFSTKILMTLVVPNKNENHFQFEDLKVPNLLEFCELSSLLCLLGGVLSSHRLAIGMTKQTKQVLGKNA